MSRFSSQKDECIILVKALPHRSSNYFETVCCAGVGRDGKWRRQYPVPFRILADSQKFGRWDWIQYQFTSSQHDQRKESQKVIPESIIPAGKMKPSERVQFINPLVRESLEDAKNRSESLALIRPEEISFSWARKTDEELLIETQKHADLANQLSLFDNTAQPLKPCPFQFTVKWQADNKTHNHTCDDWETSTAFFRRRSADGEEAALSSLKHTYEEEYMKRGLCLAFSTHSRRNGQWLLVGMIRLDFCNQNDLFL